MTSPCILRKRRLCRYGKARVGSASWRTALKNTRMPCFFVKLIMISWGNLFQPTSLASRSHARAQYLPINLDGARLNFPASVTLNHRWPCDAITPRLASGESCRIAAQRKAERNAFRVVVQVFIELVWTIYYFLMSCS